MPNNQSTAEQPVSRTKEEIVKECKRIEESVLYSSKSHFLAAEQLSEFHRRLGGSTAVLSAVASGLAFSEHNIIVGFLSLLISGLSAILTFINPNEKATLHSNAGNSYDALLNRARIFRTIDCWGDESDQVLTQRLKQLSEEKDRLNRSSPSIPKRAYEAAKRSIKAGQADFEVDAEHPEATPS
jgi:hypothetical protein